MNTLYIVTGPDNELEIFNTKVDARQYVEDKANDNEEGTWMARECITLNGPHGENWDTDTELYSCVDGEFNDHEKNPPLWMRVEQATDDILGDPVIDTTGTVTPPGTFTIGPSPGERDPDGWYRHVIDTYEHPCMTNQFERNLEEATGQKWTWLGTFMDQSCFATREPLLKEYTVYYPRG